jgi:hypothetical protein
VPAAPQQSLSVWQILLSLEGVGCMLCGLFTWESFAPHMIGSALGLVGPIFGFFVAGLALAVVFSATFSVDAVQSGRGIAGLIERVLVIEIHAWYVAIAVATTRPRAIGRVSAPS